MKIFGFSLIELIVVIAIVSLLSTAATQAYRTYVEKTRYRAMYPVIDGILTQAKEHYDLSGVWPIAADLGYDTDGTSAGRNLTQESLTIINPNLKELIIDRWPCDSVSRVDFAFNTGYTSYNDAALFWYTADINGKIHSTCDDESVSGHELVGIECIDANYATPQDLATAAGC